MRTPNSFANVHFVYNPWAVELSCLCRGHEELTPTSRRSIVCTHGRLCALLIRQHQTQRCLLKSDVQQRAGVIVLTRFRVYACAPDQTRCAEKKGSGEPDDHRGGNRASLAVTACVARLLSNPRALRTVLIHIARLCCLRLIQVSGYPVFWDIRRIDLQPPSQQGIPCVRLARGASLTKRQKRRKNACKQIPIFPKQIRKNLQTEQT